MGCDWALRCTSFTLSLSHTQTHQGYDPALITPPLPSPLLPNSDLCQQTWQCLSSVWEFSSSWAAVLVQPTPADKHLSIRVYICVWLVLWPIVFILFHVWPTFIQHKVSPTAREFPFPRKQSSKTKRLFTFLKGPTLLAKLQRYFKLFLHTNCLNIQATRHSMPKLRRGLPFFPI